MGLIGEPISEDVYKQLELRSKIIGKELKNSSDQRAINSRAAWIKVISGVDTLENGASEASRFILGGGEIVWDSTNKKFIRNEGINSQPSLTRRVYNYSEQYGIKPHPGITGFSIQHKNTFGTIREASIEFNVWNRDDLELAHRLFFRPGFPLVVEWGHTSYFDNKGKLENDIPYNEDYENYFIKYSVNKLNTLIEENKNKYGYNYDGFIGFITNFSFSFRKDGGYDCTLKAVTYGSILESLTAKVNGFAECAKRSKTFYDLCMEFFLKYASTQGRARAGSQRELLEFIEQIKSQGSSNNSTEEITPIIANTVFSSINNELKRNVFKFPAEEEPNLEWFIYKGYKDAFIPLRVFLAIINIQFTIRDAVTGNVLPTGFDLLDSNNYLTFDSHFALDPTICWLPKNVKFEKRINCDNDFTDQDFLIAPKDTLRQSLAYNNIASSKNNSGTEVGRFPLTVEGSERKIRGNAILDIRLGVRYLQNKFNGFIDQNGIEAVNVFDFLKSILQDVNENLGLINELDIYYDNDKLQYSIVDRKYNPFSNYQEGTINVKKVPVLNLTGLENIVSDVSLQSSISSQMASQIAISANGSINSLQNDVSLNHWNAGLLPRFTFDPVEDTTTCISTDDAEKIEETSKTKRRYRNDQYYYGNSEIDMGWYIKKAKELYKKLNIFLFGDVNSECDEDYYPRVIAKLYKSFNDYLNGNGGEFDKALVNGIRSRYLEVTKNSLYSSLDIETDESLSASGLIPVSLTIKIDGISGLKVGQSFKIFRKDDTPTILPDIYRMYGFIITSLNSSIENGGWYTTIKALTYRIEEIKLPQSEQTIPDTPVLEQVQLTPSTVTDQTATEGLCNDPRFTVGENNIASDLLDGKPLTFLPNGVPLIRGFNERQTLQYINSLGQRESSLRYRAINRYYFIGRYQMGRDALIDSGFYSPSAKSFTQQNALCEEVWQGGVLNVAEFLLNKDYCQEKALINYTNANYRYLLNRKGIRPDDPPRTILGMLAAAHLVGAGSASSGRVAGDLSRSKDANQVSAQKYYDYMTNAWDTNNLDSELA